MSVDKQKALLKIRTFAQDQAAHQNQVAQSADKEQPPQKETETYFEVSKMSSPAPTKHTVTVEKKTQTAHEIEKGIPKDSLPVKKEPLIVSSPTPKKIPAFHELQKEANKDIAINEKPNHTPYKKSNHRIEPKKRDRSFTSSTAIITDNRKSGVGFISRLSSSVNNWVSSIKNTFKKKKQPKYTVQDSTRRKGVIQKATTKTGAIFTADSETLREEILRRRAQQKNVSEQGEIDISWSPNTEPGYALLEAPESEKSRTQNVQVSFKKRAVPEPTIVEPTDTRWNAIPDEITPIKRPEVVIETPVYEPEESVKKEITNPRGVEFTPEPEPQIPAERAVPDSAILENKDTSDVEPETEEAVTESIAELPEFEPEFEEEVKEKMSLRDTYLPVMNLLRGKTTLSNTNSNAITIWITAIITVLAVLTIASSAIFNLLTSEQPSVETFAYNPILSGATIIKLASEEPEASLVQLLNQSDALADSSLTEIAFTKISGAPLESQDIISELKLNIDPNFAKSVNTIHFVIINQTEHAFVLEVSDPTTVFGALLGWEKIMASELRESLDLPTLSPAAKFTDMTILNSDVRVLKDDGVEILVYGFINKDILLITTNTTSFTQLVSQQ